MRHDLATSICWSQMSLLEKTTISTESLRGLCAGHKEQSNKEHRGVLRLKLKLLCDIHFIGKFIYLYVYI